MTPGSSGTSNPKFRELSPLRALGRRMSMRPVRSTAIDDQTTTQPLRVH